MYYLQISTLHPCILYLLSRGFDGELILLVCLNYKAGRLKTNKTNIKVDYFSYKRQ